MTSEMENKLNNAEIEIKKQHAELLKAQARKENAHAALLEKDI